MKTHLQRLAGLTLWGALAVASPARAADANAIQAIDVAERDGAVELSIRGTRPPSYTVFKLQDPPRLVVDLAGADVSAVGAPLEVGKGGVLGVSTAQYKDERSAVGRVVVALDGARRYEVAPKGDAVVVRVLAAESAAAQPSTVPGVMKLAETALVASAAEAAPAAVPAAPAAEPAAPPAAKLTEPIARAPEAPAAVPSDNVLARRIDEAPVKKAARAVTGVRPAGKGLLLATDGDVGTIEIIELANPPRLALDLLGVARAPKAAVKLDGAFGQARFGRDAGKVRVVLDAVGALPAYQVRRVPGGIAVRPGAGEQVAAAPKAPAAAAKPAAAPRPAAPALAAGPARARIADVRFSHAGGASRIEIAGKAKYAISRPDARTVVLSLEGAELPKRLERSLDTSALGGPVLMVSSFNQPSTGQVKIVATLRGPAADALAEHGDGLAWTFAETAPAEGDEPPVVLSDATQAASAEAGAAGFAAEAPAYAASGAPRRGGYTGRRISLDFHDIDIRNLLRLISDVSKRNLVVADDVQGKVTVSLRNVPWDQALDLILKSKGLGKEEAGNIIRIAKLEDLAKEQEALAAAAKARQPLVPLKVRLIPVNFARAGEVAGRVKDVLTERGSISTDERTNVLIVKDVQEALVRAEGLVRNLDTETPQVLIESRIVEASSNFNKAVGIQWGGNASMSQALGNPTGLVFPNIVTGAGAAGGGPTTGTASNPNYAVNLPAAIGQGAGGGIGLVFGSAGGAFNLNLRLSALENSGVVKTISAPKIATIDNKEATIGQGISIPFSQVSASGVNTTFIEAKLELRVTPHVSADGSILLKIRATNNAPNPQLTGANGQPSISKREAETEVLVKDGETTVIGGIYTRQISNRRSEVPFFGKIPILGYFFRTTTDQDDHTELLIFITPRILNRAATTVAGGH
ncbi:MAG TPA: type IV pilus secretin PilQ [Anaeromyxobacteraceae bacterium]|nr:type IV pilus secretin PilQ [Anaeromyxobacteraceae bacterium]